MTARFFVASTLLLLAGRPADAAPDTAAVFDFQLANLGQLPPTEADKARLPRISELLRRQLADSGRFKIISIPEAVKVKVANAAELRSCGGCAADFAKEAGAHLAITGEVQKVSNLILNINVYIKEVGGTKSEQAYSVDIRGDNDLSFDRSVKYLVKDRILRE
jgi:hypothetical protein